MIRSVSRGIVACSSVMALAIGSPAVAAPSDVSDLVGARGSSGESELESRGYVLQDSAQGEDRSYTYWWNARSKSCIRVTTNDGRYSDIRKEDASDCGQKGSDKGTGVAVAIGAAALIGALALSHKSHNHDGDKHYGDAQSEADYERGYRDGLYNQAYHNYSRSDPYSRGYEAGVRQREQNTSYRPGYGNGAGYGGFVYVDDLIGQDRERGESELSRRGFVTTDTRRTNNDGRYTTFWRASSKQCIIVNTRGGNVYAIDAVRPRSCR